MQGSLDQRPTGGVFRLRQDIGRMSTLGVLYTGRAGSDYYNHVAGADGFFRLDQKNSVIFQFLHSETDYPTRSPRLTARAKPASAATPSTFSSSTSPGTGSSTRCTKTCPRASGPTTASCPASTPGRGTATVFRQIWGKPKGWFNLIRLGVMGQAVYDHAGTLTDRGLTLGVMAYQGNLETLVNVHGNFLRTFYDGQYFDTAFGPAIHVPHPPLQRLGGRRPGHGRPGHRLRQLAAGQTSSPSGRTLSLNLFRRLNLVASHSLRTAVPRRRHDLHRPT